MFSSLRSGAAAIAGLGLITAGLAFSPTSSAAAVEKLDVIVTLAPQADASTVARNAARGNNAEVNQVYQHAMNGFAASLPQPAIDALRKRKDVVAVEPDVEVTTLDSQHPTPSWGLDRIDQRNLPGDDTFNYNATGAGVKAYVVDTGIDINHPDFGGRAVTGADLIDNNGDAGDCNGHGTHVAGTIGGQQYGVAKEVELVAVRVLGCTGSGSTSGVIAGLDWIIEDHRAGRPAVANMSLGGGRSAALDDAVARVMAAGVTMVVAAGNDNADACNSSPARVRNALTTGASDQSDRRASFSNVGTCIDLFAPGVGITSAWLDGGTRSISGTSMAAPHVAGVAAQYLATNTGASPAAVRAEVLGATTKGKVTDTDGGCVLIFLLCTPATPNNDVLFTSY